MALRCQHDSCILIGIGVVVVRYLVLYWSYLRGIESRFALIFTGTQVAIIVPVCLWTIGTEIRWRTRISHDLLKSVLSSYQKLLLLANDHASSADTHPSYKWLGFESVLVHDIKSNEGSSSTKSSSAVYSDGLPTSRITLSQGNEIANYPILRAGAIREFHLMNLDLVSCEAVSIVKFTVKPDYTLDIQVKELFYEVIWPHITDNFAARRIHRVLRRRESYY